MTGHEQHLASAVEAHAGARYKRRLALAFGLIAVYFVVEAVGGFLTNSLALLSDAGHMFTDVLGLGMALAAIHLATSTARDRQRTFGLYRLEILAALANAVLLLGVAAYILVAAVRRMSDPPEVLGGPMLVVAALGLGVNLVAFFLLRSGRHASLNVEAAYLEVVADTLGSVGVVIAAVLLETTGWRLVDPIFGVAIGLFVLPRALRLGLRALRILVQAAPPHIDTDELQRDLSRIGEVIDVHDLHVWTLTSGMDVASVHLRLAEGADEHAALDSARRVLRDRYTVRHATVQVEPGAHADCADCEAVHW